MSPVFADIELRVPSWVHIHEGAYVCVNMLKPNTALNEIPVLELWGVTCRVGSQCYLPLDTTERAPPYSH